MAYHACLASRRWRFASMDWFGCAISAAKCVAALRAIAGCGPTAAQIFTRRRRSSAGESEPIPQSSGVLRRGLACRKKTELASRKSLADIFHRFASSFLTSVLPGRAIAIGGIDLHSSSPQRRQQTRGSELQAAVSCRALGEATRRSRRHKARKQCREASNRT